MCIKVNLTQLSLSCFMELTELNTSVLHIPWDHCSKALFVKTSTALEQLYERQHLSCMWSGEIVSVQRMAAAGWCLPGAACSFPSPSHLLALAAALQQPGSTSREPGQPGHSHSPLVPLPAWLLSAQSPNAELPDVWSLFAMWMHTARPVCSLGFSALWSTAKSKGPAPQNNTCSFLFQKASSSIFLTETQRVFLEQCV